MFSVCINTTHTIQIQYFIKLEDINIESIILNLTDKVFITLFYEIIIYNKNLNILIFNNYNRRSKNIKVQK